MANFSEDLFDVFDEHGDEVEILDIPKYVKRFLSRNLT